MNPKQHPLILDAQPIRDFGWREPLMTQQFSERPIASNAKSVRSGD
jgi:hypothetical protein